MTYTVTPNNVKRCNSFWDIHSSTSKLTDVQLRKANNYSLNGLACSAVGYYKKNKKNKAESE